MVRDPATRRWIVSIDVPQCLQRSLRAPTTSVPNANGEGVPQDYIQANKWVNLAASRPTGEVMDDSRLLRDKLAEIMTASRVAEAQRLA